MQEIETESESHPEDPVPDDVLDAAGAAFATRSNGDLMVLVRYSLVDEGDPPDSHVLRFEHERMGIEVEVSAMATTTSLRGRTTKPAGGRFEILFFGSTLDFVQNSDDGTFAFGPLGHGVVRIALEPAGASRLDTDWFRI